MYTCIGYRIAIWLYMYRIAIWSFKTPEMTFTVGRSSKCFCDFIYVCVCVCVWVRACLAFSLSFKHVWSFLKVLGRGYSLLFFLHSFSTLASETNGCFLYLTDCWLTSSGICRKEAVQSVSVCGLLSVEICWQTNSLLSIFLVLVIFPFIHSLLRTKRYFLSEFLICSCASFI